MEWNTAKLSSVAKFSQGKQIPIENQFLEDGINRDRFIRIVDFTSGFRELPRYVEGNPKYHVHNDDVIMIRYGTPGRVFRGVSGIIANNMFKITFNETVINKNYGYWFLKQESIYNFLMLMNCSATMPAISFKMLNRVIVQIPTLSVQHRIASILSTYDMLIENNTKRIRLLEKMAENLYKEWFVRFRFPGHENVKMVNGLPNGWKKGALSDVCEFKRGKNITSSEMKDGTIPVISAGITPSGFHSHANVHGISVTMSSSGANAGYIAVHYSDIWAADCSYIEEASTPYIYYVYELLNNIRSIINNFQRGAAQPHVYPKDINRIKMIIPSEDIRKKANEKIGVIHRQIDNLQRQNSLLARQRDLLLPRLMSGKLEV